MLYICLFCGIRVGCWRCPAVHPVWWPFYVVCPQGLYWYCALAHPRLQLSEKQNFSFVTWHSISSMIQIVKLLKIKLSRADLGFYKGGCPIHPKGAPEGQSPRHALRRRACGAGVGLPQKISKPRHSQMHFPGISGHYKLYDWVCFYDMSGVDLLAKLLL